MQMQRALPDLQPLIEHGHVDRQAVQMVREEVRQHVVDEVDENQQCVLLVHLHDLENDRGENVKALAIADGFVVACEREKDASENRSIGVIRRPMGTGPVQILEARRVRSSRRSFFTFTFMICASSCSSSGQASGLKASWHVLLQSR